MDKRIVVFDDNNKRRESLEMLINLTEGYVCTGTFSDCSNVVSDVEKSQPDLILMDIEMPNKNGIEGIKLLRKKFPSIIILMQTVFEEDDKIFASIRAGADGYILKKSSPQDMLKAIADALNGGAPMSPSIAKQVLKFVSTSSYTHPIQNYNLTSRESEILSLLVQGLSYKMIADRCQISLYTVNSHIQNIYDKLQVNSAVEAVTKAIDNKIV